MVLPFSDNDSIGLVYTVGNTGNTGDTGPTGALGPTGDAGIDGPTGKIGSGVYGQIVLGNVNITNSTPNQLTNVSSTGPFNGMSYDTSSNGIVAGSTGVYLVTLSATGVLTTGANNEPSDILITLRQNTTVIRSGHLYTYDNRSDTADISCSLSVLLSMVPDDELYVYSNNSGVYTSVTLALQDVILMANKV